MTQTHEPVAEYAERQVIGAALLSPQALGPILERLSPDDFSVGSYAMVYRAIGGLAMTGRPVSGQSVCAELSREPSTEPGFENALAQCGGPAAIYRLLEGVDPDEYDYWVETVLRLRWQRRMRGYAAWLQEYLSGPPGDPAAAAALIEERLSAVNDRETSNIRPVSDLEALRRRVQKYITDPGSITGIPTGWGPFDEMLDGLQPGNVTIVYAPSSRFKSMFVTNLGYRASLNGAPGLWFTTEMPVLQVQERLVQLHAGLNFRRLRAEGLMRHYEPQVNQAMEEVAALPIYMCDTASLTTASVRSSVMKYRRWRGIEYVIVDLVDMVSTDSFRDDSVAQQSQVMRQMKDIAKQANVHVVLVSHVSKGERGMSYYRQPYLLPEEMKGSSSKFQDVDVAVSLMPVRVSPQTGDWMGLTLDEIAYAVRTDGAMTVLVTITKNRHGEVGEIPFFVSVKNGGRMGPIANMRKPAPVGPVED